MAKKEKKSVNPDEHYKVIKLFFVLPIYKVRTAGNKKKSISVCGLPVYKFKKSDDNLKTKYYFFGIPTFKVKNAKDGQKVKYYLFGLHFMTVKKEYI